MTQLNDLKKEENLLKIVEWDITHKNDPQKNISYYFVVNTLEDEPRIYLVKRNLNGVEEMSEITLPGAITESFLEFVGNQKVVYAIEADVKSHFRRQPGHVNKTDTKKVCHDWDQECMMREKFSELYS